MGKAIVEVASPEALVAASRDPSVFRIVITQSLVDVPTVRLSPGQSLSGQSQEIQCCFAQGEDGLQVSTDNAIRHLQLITDLNRRAIFNDTRVEGLGTIELQQLRVIGLVHLVAREQVRSGHVDVHELELLASDARHAPERPRAYGVEVIPGAFTLWNQQVDPTVSLTAKLIGLSAGRPGSPVRGSGIFLSGASDAGGRLVVTDLQTGPVYSDGDIPAGTADRISAGIFTGYGAFIDTVRNSGPVTTYGPNDMVLDNWGTVDSWIAEEKVTSFGPSAIGFVNFGTLNHLRVDGTIETYGRGSRGFNVYGGTVQTAEFHRIVTHADGAVGVQVSQPVGEIKVRRGVETHGGTGDSLVKGVVMKLAAIPLSVKPGGAVRKLEINGGLVSKGERVPALELHGSIDSLQISGGFIAQGEGFDSI